MSDLICQLKDTSPDGTLLTCPIGNYLYSYVSEYECITDGTGHVSRLDPVGHPGHPPVGGCPVCPTGSKAWPRHCLGLGRERQR